MIGEAILSYGINKLANKGLDYVVSELNIPGFSSNVFDEIQKAHEETLNKWSKNQGAKDRAWLKVNELIKKNYSAILNKQELPNELQEYLECFRQTIALKKYENAFSYLTNKQYQAYFEKIEFQMEVFSKTSVSKDDLDNAVKQIEKGQDNQTEELKSFMMGLMSKNRPSITPKFKQEALFQKDFFVRESDLTKISEYHIKRFLKHKDDSEADEDSYFMENSPKQTLDELVRYKNEQFILLKGQPGIGKSNELQKLAKDLIETKETDLIPFYISLKNFTNQDTFHTFFNLEFLHDFQNVVLILDGLDEINNEQDFLSKLSNFIRSRLNPTYKIVLSCRSSILDSFKNEVRDFQVYELQELDIFQAQELLKHKTHHEFDLIEIQNFQYKSSFLNDPFKLNIVAQFYNTEGVLESNPVKLWENYVATILKIDQKDKLIKRGLKFWNIKDDSKKVALFLELIKELNIDEDNLKSILDQDQDQERFDAFVSCALIIAEQDFYFYEHKQLQEYLAAAQFSGFSSDKIKEIISVDGANAVKPSLENTLTMLLDILSNDKEKQQAIAEWVFGNKPDLLFKADRDRLQSFQVPVFQYFFNNSIKDSKLWLRNTTSISEEEIAQFADCQENFDYLMRIINSEEEHFRTRTTALSILAHFEPRRTSKNELFQLLKPNADRAHININSGIIDVFKHWRLVTYEPEIISDVIEVFEEDDHSEPASRILSLILTDLEHLDKYMSFIEREMKFEFDREERKNDDGVNRLIRWKFERMLTEVQNDDVFLNYLRLLLNQSKYDSYNSEQFEKDIIKRLNSIKETDQKKLIDFFTNYFQIHKPDYFNHRKPSYRIVKELELAKSLFERLFEPEFFKENYGICAHLIYLDPTSFEIFKDRIDNFKTLDQQLEYFRNNVNSYNKRDLALSIEKVLEDNGFNLNDKISDHKAFDELQKEFNQLIQQETELMFEKSELYQLCENHFKEAGKDSVCKKDFYATKRDFKNNSQLVNTFGYETLAERIIFKACIYFNKDCVNLKDCREYLDDEMAHFEFIFKEIQSHKGNTHLNIDFTEINAKLQVLVSSISESVKTDNLISFLEDGSFSLNKEYPSFLMIQNIHQLLIDDTLTLKASDEFILNTLAYFDFKNFDNDTSKFVKLTDKITNKDKLKEKIIVNLQTELVSSVYTKHALFALNHGFSEAFKDIESHLLEDKDIYSGDALLKPFVEKNGTNILKKMCNDLHTRACWTAIELLFKQGSHNDYCITKAKDYLASGEEKFLKYASKVLFEMNEKAIIDYILKDVVNRIKVLYSLNHTNFQNYSVVPSNGLSGIETLFNKIYSETDFDDHDFSYSNSFFINYSINLVTHQKKYLELKDLFEKQRNVAEEENSDRKIFFVNSLLKDIEKAHINSLSKAMDFDEALNLVREIS